MGFFMPIKYLYVMGKRIIITESEKRDIQKMYGLLNEQNDVITQYVTDPRLQKIIQEIQTTFGEVFTKEHFEKEIGLSGQIKPEAGSLLPQAINAFNKMKSESGCNDIFIKEIDDKDPNLNVSYRSYDDQKIRFINEGKNAPIGQKINTAMKRVSIPGYSQHHTGFAIDYGGNTICLRKNAWPNGDFNKPNNWGFTLPYMSGGNIRMSEPWHLQYVGGTQQQSQTQSQSNTNPTQIKKGNTTEQYNKFYRDIRKRTTNTSIDLNSIDLDMINLTFDFNPGNTKIETIHLLIGRQDKNGSKENNLQTLKNRIISGNPNSNVEEYAEPTTCNDCMVENGNIVPIKYQMMIVYPSKK